MLQIWSKPYFGLAYLLSASGAPAAPPPPPAGGSPAVARLSDYKKVEVANEDRYLMRKVA